MDGQKPAVEPQLLPRAWGEGGLSRPIHLCSDAPWLSPLAPRRYAMRHESAKDRFTYHATSLVEWDHGRFGTVVELAWRFGVGGYSGKANWHADKDAEGGPSLGRAMHPSVVAPWVPSLSELRCYDVPMSDADEFLEFLKRWASRERARAPGAVRGPGRFAATAVEHQFHKISLAVRGCGPLRC